MNMSENVLFTRDEECDSDIWDDTELIKAYDHAISSVKTQLEEAAPIDDSHEVTSVVMDNETQGKKKKKKRGKSKRLKQQANSANGNASKRKTWKVGDLCRAVFTEDGVLYDATIISIDTVSETCVIKYLGYGNEEDKRLQDLITVGRKQRRTIRQSTNFVHNHQPSQHPFMPPIGLGGSPHLAQMPFMPPPPPPIDDSISSDREALYSMLIAWYMSGYHTGYYQGLQKRNQLSQLPHSSRNETSSEQER